MQRSAGRAKTGNFPHPKATGRCVLPREFYSTIPHLGLWDDHSDASRRAQGCAYGDDVGTWRSPFRVLQGSERIPRFS